MARTFDEKILSRRGRRKVLLKGEEKPGAYIMQKKVLKGGKCEFFQEGKNRSRLGTGSLILRVRRPSSMIYYSGRRRYYLITEDGEGGIGRERPKSASWDGSLQGKGSGKVPIEKERAAPV